MKNRPYLFTLIIMMILMLISCSIFPPADDKSQEADQGDTSELSQSQVLDIVWQVLEPNTASHEQANWQVIKAETVTGGSLAGRFEGEPAPGCWSGPEPPENEDIISSKNYWYILMTPKPATPEPFGDTPSPTAPPKIPEPFLREAHFLVDPKSGEVIARKLLCVIY